MNELIVEQEKNKSYSQTQFSKDKIELIREVFCKGASENEFLLFLAQCERTGLDPITRQIYIVSRWTRSGEVFTTQVSIDGFRVIAERTKKYAGQLPPLYYTKDHNWVDVWVEKYPPLACKVGVLRKDFDAPTYATASWDSYAQLDKSGEPTHMWKKFGSVMLAKCAESLALRKAFPQALGGLYTEEEMSQSDSEYGQIAPNRTLLTNTPPVNKEPQTAEKSYPVEKIVQSWIKAGRIGNDEISLASASEAVSIVGDTPVLESNSKEWTENFMSVYEGIKATKSGESSIEAEIEAVAIELGGEVIKSS